ncbi:class I adenylate-forming enzyme family protein [Paenibacillus sp. FSL R7-269]|uniref:class I adenylate-forming enzyme family protein n=1 Tax=Paenibacillus sp. FSL R7-269 TaxID=1226755 RepID=UPI0004AC71C9|nr:class I adenylate-forming enzyme family protein [Paenibacillus sp. FSL R7-269]
MMTIIQRVFMEACDRKEHIILQDIKQHWTYAEVMTEAYLIALYIKKNFDLEAGSHLAVYTNNEPLFITAALGIQFCGHVLVPVPYSASKTEIENILNASDVRLVISKYAQPAHLNCDIHWVTAQDLSQEPMPSFESIPLTNPSDSNPCAILLPTSGTTGKSKIVMLSHRNVLTNALAHGEKVGYTDQDSFLVTMPVHFSSTIVTQLISCMLHGTRIILISLPLLPRTAFRLFQNKAVTAFSAVPTQLMQFVSDFHQTTNWSAFDSIEFIVISGAAIPAKLVDHLQTVFPKADIIQTYGLTEASPRVSMMERGDRSLSCGSPVSGVSIRLVDEEENEVKGTAATGEIWVKGPNVMLGYYKNPELTNVTIVDGWLKTGDLGYWNESGCLILTGRKKNIIISGGINIYPEEIEEFLYGLKEVEEVMVVGVHDDLLGEVPIAFLKVFEECLVNIDALTQHCNLHLSSYKVPRQWRIIDDIPKTKTGKLDRASTKRLLLNE